ncbi:MAG: FmdB family zinc ribbon protein [Anaerolineae bacterium]
MYEYRCAQCGAHFQELRSMAQADAPITCPACGGGDTHRLISLFAAHRRAASGEPVSVAGGTGCSGCSASSCAGCKH